MKQYLVFASSMLLAAGMAFAQDVNAAGQVGATTNQPGEAQESSHSNLRGCLTGSTDNFTLTDANGTIYHLRGANAQLGPAIGHEVQLTGTREGSAGQNSGGYAQSTSFVQVADVTDTGKPCQHAASGSSQPPSTGVGDESTPRPMDQSTPKGSMDESTPKGAPDQTPPPKPQLMAMLQQSGGAAAQDSNSNSSMSSPANSTSQASQSVNTSTPSTSNNSTDTVNGKTGSHGTQVPTSSTNSTGQNTPPAETTNGAAGTTGGATSPPVTSQTPAASNSPTSPNSQLGAPNPNSTGQTPGQANSNATAASQGELSTNPQTGQTTGRGVNNQGVNNPTASPNTPAANTNDANKPLYERQATDVPWANHSSNNPNTNTSTTPQSNPQ